MQSFIISVNAILPIFIIMFLGVALRKTGLLPEAVAQSLNKLTFKLLLPLSLFKSISASDFRAAVDSRFLLGCVGLILLVFATARVLVSLCVKDNARRGALIHGTFRSNYIILGMPVVEALFGADQVASAAVVTAVAVPMFNVLAVFTLEYFRGGTPSPRAILKGIAKNPLIWGCVLGMTAALLPFDLPTILTSPRPAQDPHCGAAPASSPYYSLQVRLESPGLFHAVWSNRAKYSETEQGFILGLRLWQNT